jgi:hypothetical protein
MSKISFRLDEELYQRLCRRAQGAGIPLSTFLRGVLTQAADPRGRYIYSSQDEILATSIQVLSILATFVGRQSPVSLEKGLEEARSILEERGLLAGGMPS